MTRAPASDGGADGGAAPSDVVAPAPRRRTAAAAVARGDAPCRSCSLYVVSIAVALGLCALLVSATGGSASEVFSALLDGSLRSPGAWGLTINTAAPLLVVAVGTIVRPARPGCRTSARRARCCSARPATAFVATRLEAPGLVRDRRLARRRRACSAGCGRCSPRS